MCESRATINRWHVSLSCVVRTRCLQRVCIWINFSGTFVLRRCPQRDGLNLCFRTQSSESIVESLHGFQKKKSDTISLSADVIHVSRERPWSRCTSPTRVTRSRACSESVLKGIIPTSTSPVLFRIRTIRSFVWTLRQLKRFELLFCS